MKIKKLLCILFSLPKTIYFNFRTLPVKQAIHLPFFINYRVELGTLSRVIELPDDQIHLFMIKFGLGGSDGVNAGKGYFSCGASSRVIFKGSAVFGAGCSLRVDCGLMQFGKKFYANRNCFISCTHKIVFGDDVFLGFNIAVRDSDGHTVLKNGNKKVNLLPVMIGDHVWICSETDILKGSSIGSDCVVSYRSCVFGDFSAPHCLIGGYPARVLQDQISWEQ